MNKKKYLNFLINKWILLRFSARNSSFLCKQLVVSLAEKRLFGHPHQNRSKSLCIQGFPEIEDALILTTPSPNPHHILNWHHQQILQSYHEWQEGEEELKD